MKSVIKFSSVIFAQFFLLCSIDLLSLPKVQDKPDSTVINSSFFELKPTYSQIKTAFLRQFGKDTANWPFFIKRLGSINSTLQKKYDKSKMFQNTRGLFAELDNLKLEKGTMYTDTYLNSLRNYYGINDYFANYWDNEVKNPNKDNIERSYFNLGESEGILPNLFYFLMYNNVSKDLPAVCPTGMLDWYFSEFFPILTHLYAQKEFPETQKVINSIHEYVLKLIEKHYYVKAKIISKTIQSFINYNFLQYVKDQNNILEGLDWLNYKLAEQTKNQFYKDFNFVFYDKIWSKFSGLSHEQPDIIKRTKSMKNSIVATLKFERDVSDGTQPALVRCIRIMNMEFAKEYNQVYNAEIKLDQNLVKKAIEALGMRGGKIGPDFMLLNKIGELKFYINRLKEGESQDYYVIAFKENSSLALQNNLSVPKLNNFYLDFMGDLASLRLNIDPDFRKEVQRLTIEAFIEASEEVLGSKRVIPLIYGMEQNDLIVKDYAIKMSATPIEIKPDGKSTAEISAQLYEFYPDVDLPSKPLQGKKLSFKVDRQQGITPGTISDSTATTDADGIARVTLTAPEMEYLSTAKLLVNTSTVTAKSADYNCEEMTFIRFSLGKGRIFAEPSIDGIVSSKAIVPPDNRFPALIRALYEDDNLNPLKNIEVTFSIRNEKDPGLLLDKDGKTGRTLVVKTGNDGYAEINYIYDSNVQPEKPLTVEVEAISKEIPLPLVASVAVGLNIVFESVENAYEGKGQINAGEQIPLRIKIKDAWNPEIDVSEIMSYWGTGGVRGDVMTFAKLEINQLGDVPDYLLDHYKVEKWKIEEPFTEFMRVRSFKDKGALNMLWMPESTLKGYQGYPRVKPTKSGTYYYELKLTLVDSKGNTLFQFNHPAQIACLTLNTGISAETMDLFINLNPFLPHDKRLQLLREILAFKCGTVVSVLDALDAINRGNTDDLWFLLFGELKSAMLNKVGEKSADAKLMVDSYSKLTLAEKITQNILQDKEGILAKTDKAVFAQLKRAFSTVGGQVVVLIGEGNQKLFVDKNAPANSAASKPEEKKGLSLFKGNVNISLSGISKKTNETLGSIAKAVKGGSDEIPAGDDFVTDKKLKTSALKRGNVSVYIIPDGMRVRSENASEMKIY